MRFKITITMAFIFMMSVIFIYISNQKPEKKLSGAYQALNFWTDSRAYPNKDISKDAQYKAFAKQRNQLQKAASLSADDTVAVWKNMGPDNVPGRMISLAVNPQNSNTLYAGSASGGLWRTHNSSTGANWQRITTGYPVLGVMAIAIDPADTNNIYIGTGEVYGYQKSIGGTVIRTTRGSYGIGILKSEDGGATWSKSLDWTEYQQRGVQVIEINPLNSESIYAGTSEGLYKSTDGGVNWTLKLDKLMVQDIVIHTDDTSKVIVSCGNLGSTGTGLYRSFDAGENWSFINGLPVYSGKTLLEMHRDNPNLVYASVADSVTSIGLYKTSNFGSNWKKIHGADVQRYQGFFAHWVAVHPSDSMQVVHAGVDIYKSTNGGASLSTISGPHVDHHNYAHDPQNPGILYIANDGGVYRSTNFGSSYSSIGYGLVTAQFYNGFSSSYQDSALAMGGLQDNNTIITYGSKDWVRKIGGDGTWSAINANDDNILYGSWQNNNIQKSTNRGQTFVSATNGINQSGAAFVAPYVISESNPDILYSGRKTVFKTINAAENWTATNGGDWFDGNSILSMAVSKQDPNYVLAATAPTATRAGVYRTTDGGTNWDNVTSTLPDRYPMDIAIDPQNKNIAYIVFNGFGTGHVYKTTDAGQSWDDITGWLPDLPTLSVVIDPANSNHVYVGNDLAVYFSADGGNNWETFARGLPEAVIAMDLNIAIPNRKLRVATHGNGAWQRPLVYKPAALLVYNYDSVPGTVLEGTEIYFSGSISNFGSQPFAETITISIKVIDVAEQEVYSASEDVCCINPDDQVSFYFDTPFTTNEPGEYTIQYSANGETTFSQFTVIQAPSVAAATIQKDYVDYTEILNSVNLPTGDDVQAKVNLPFTFIFDGYEYDKVQISSNGWIEFGTGTDGTEHGLSTSQQIGSIGANQNGSMASTSRPTKVLGPWWEDLNTDGGGQISYFTSGKSPQRDFIIQYKNMRAYWDPATTTRINFQVHLYENSNRIEYHYGPVINGTFSGGDLGASIGFKDFIGGDYHFYDIIAGGSIPAGDVVTDLSPLVDWPGPDSMFVIQTVLSALEKDDDPGLPLTLTLKQNYPNPFNPTTTIGYYLDKKSTVTLSVFDVLGRRVKTLINLTQQAGFKQAVWDGRNTKGEAVGSGIYFYVLQTAERSLSRKMMLMK